MFVTSGYAGAVFLRSAGGVPLPRPVPARQQEPGLPYRFDVSTGDLVLSWDEGASGVPDAGLEGLDLIITADDAEDYFLDGDNLVLEGGYANG
jgi:hypothetical protein